MFYQAVLLTFNPINNSNNKRFSSSGEGKVDNLQSQQAVHWLCLPYKEVLHLIIAEVVPDLQLHSVLEVTEMNHCSNSVQVPIGMSSKQEWYDDLDCTTGNWLSANTVYPFFSTEIHDAVTAQVSPCKVRVFWSVSL